MGVGRGMIRSAAVVVGAVVWSTVAANGAVGPDVIVGRLDDVGDYARLGDTAALAMATVSCNAGDEVLNWYQLPNNQHPVIGQNLYRLKDGRLEQIGQAWLKHGFAALQGTTCFADCVPHSSTGLGVHCSDPYSHGLNQGPGLGPRGEVNPFTGYFDGATADDHTGHVHTGISHGLQVKHADLGNAGARYFAEGHYVAPDDATAGNGNNNASWLEVAVTGTSANWTFTNIGGTVREQPAIFAWTGSTRTILDSWPTDGRVIVAYKVTALGGGQYRYDYAVYNMNSERAIGSFSVPVGAATITNVGFHAVLSHDAGLSNDVWPSVVADGDITWSTDTFQTDPDANAIRWGTMYNFWFDANLPPIISSATLGRFKPGPGGAVTLGVVQAPAAADCNNNGTPDDQDILPGGESDDCNPNGIPDECEVAGNDCNMNLVPDDCDVAAGPDCNGNSIPDSCDLAGPSLDCNANLTPDECELAVDCNSNLRPDDCDLAGNDCNGDLVPDDCQVDCDFDGTIDACEAAPDCNLNGTPDNCDVNGLVGGAVSYPSGTVDLAIPDNNSAGVSHTLLVSAAGNVTDVNVSVNLTHTWVADLIITLTHGTTTVTLWDGVCGANDGIAATFDDEGSTLTCGNPTVGTFRPTAAGGSPLSGFDGSTASGNWTIKLVDTFPSDAGVLSDWTLVVETPNQPPVSEDVNGNGIPDECEEICATVAECNDDNACTLDDCTNGLCVHPVTGYGDVNGSGLVDLDDILCVLDGFAASVDCVNADIYPCQPNGLIDIDDILAELDAYNGDGACCGP